MAVPPPSYPPTVIALRIFACVVPLVIVAAAMLEAPKQTLVFIGLGWIQLVILCIVLETLATTAHYARESAASADRQEALARQAAEQRVQLLGAAQAAADSALRLEHQIAEIYAPAPTDA